VQYLSMSKRVVLWTASRCVSTAFERSMMELESCKVFHEPFYHSFYYGPERQSERFKHHSPDEKKSYGAIEKALVADYDGIELVFSKDMAYYIRNRFEEVIQGGLCQFQHTFLIRSPSKAIRSFYEGCINKLGPGWEIFDPDESGFKELLELYKFIVARKEKYPIVVDADDLLQDPEGIMRAYFEGIGVKFDKRILEWEARPVPAWDACGGWHDNALYSTGFGRKDFNKSKINGYEMTDEESLPDSIMEAIETSMLYYKELHKNRITAKRGAEEK